LIASPSPSVRICQRRLEAPRDPSQGREWGSQSPFLPTDDETEPVSVVGDVNDWTPRSHPLRRRSDGTRSATITLPAGELDRSATSQPAVGGFDDPEADAQDQEGSLLTP
jgi:hypothetical protein